MLRPIGEKMRFAITRAPHIAQVLIIPPEKLNAKAGPKSVPLKREPTVILIIVIIMPVLKPYNSRAVSVIMFEKPNRNHGSGAGIKLSRRCNATAKAERIAT